MDIQRINGNHETDVDIIQPTIEQNSNKCEVCHKTFGTFRGLRIHEGRVRKKKTTQCKPIGRKTRYQSSQESNHSVVTMVTAEPSTEKVNLNEEGELKRPKVLCDQHRKKRKAIDNLRRRSAS